jgi:hypothetical protein
MQTTTPPTPRGGRRPFGFSVGPRADAPLCLHLGLPKTATKLLQRHLFRHHSHVDYLGKFLKATCHGPQRLRLEAAAQQVMSQVLEERAFQPDLDHCRALARSHFAKPAPGRRIMMWSTEDLSQGCAARQAARARNLRAVFGSCRVMIVLRHPLKYVESDYFQALKCAHVGRGWGHHKRIGLFDIETRLNRVWAAGEDNDLSRLRYAQTIQVFSEAFGKEAVGVFVFEELAADPKSFIRKVCDFLGIDPQEGWNLCQGRRENDRWTAEQLLRLRKIEDSRWRREVFRRSPTRLRCWLLGLSRTGQPSRPGPKAEIDIPLDWRRRIEDLTREGNRWLAEEWDLPLAKYGYPV